MRPRAVVVFLGLIALDVAVPQVAGRRVLDRRGRLASAGVRDRRLSPLASHLPAGVDRADPHPIRTRGPSARRARGCRRTATTSSLAVLVVSLWLRLVATNGDGRGAGGVSRAALGLARWPSASCSRARRGATTSVRSRLSRSSTPSRAGCATRRTPSAPRARPASRPAPTSTRRTATGRRSSRRPRRAPTTRFPAWSLAFYLYYYLQAGTWAYYFDGSWTNQAGLIRTAFLPGHDAMTAGFFFLPVVPRAVAAAVDAGGRSRDQPADAVGRRAASRRRAAHAAA